MSNAVLPDRFPVINVSVSAVTMERTLQVIDQWIKKGEKHYLSVCTTHTIIECYDNPEMANVVRGASIATPDGMPLVWVGKYYKQDISRVYGPDLMLALSEQGIQEGYKHFFYGGAPGVVEKLAQGLQKHFPNLQIAGVYTPPFRPLTSVENQEVIEMINNSGADIVWVGLGTPKQDLWCAQMRPYLNASVIIPVGAAFDFHAGVKRQAPKWMQRSGLEWLFRMVTEPKRLARRYAVNNPRFIYHIVKQMLAR